MAAALNELAQLKAEFGAGCAERKCALLRVLEKTRLPGSKDVFRLHELLCFLRAYPDDAAVLAQVEHMLAVFEQRSDLRRHREELADSGIAGTRITFSFFTPSALWLAQTCGSDLSIVWPDFEKKEDLDCMLPLLALYAETPGLDGFTFGPRGWLKRMKASDETDASFLLRRLGQLPLDGFIRERIFDSLEVPLRLSPSPRTPARTREKLTGLPIAYQKAPLDRRRPRLSQAVRRPPVGVRLLSPAAGSRLIELARAAMAVRSRDLDAFAYGDRNDVHLVDCGRGLHIAYVGVISERRFLLEAHYGLLLLKNGVPIGYGANSALFGSSEVAYTVFDTFRAGEAAMMFGRVLAVARHVFGSDSFMIDRYQIGDDNDDALRSGAWWFYQKLGFRPRDANLTAMMNAELKRMKRNSKYLSPIRTLKKLSSGDLFYHLGRRRDDVLGVLSLGRVGLRVTNYLAERFGSNRRRAERVCVQDAAGRLGVRSVRGWSSGERLAWKRWAPLITILPGLDRWTRHQKQALVAVVRAKGGKSELEYLRRFDKHRRLREAIEGIVVSGEG